MRTPLAGAALAVAALLSLSACGDSSDDDDQAAADVSGTTPAQRPIVLDTAKKKPDLVLTDTDGKKYDLLERTKGKPTLLYFGYTYCPDVCSLVMSNIGMAEKKLSAAERDTLQVVFVTTDPKRDTPKRLRSWLDGQGASDVIGLTGDFDTIQAAARPLGISVEPPKKEKDGSITSNHSAEVLGFSPKDDRGHWLWTTDTSTRQYAKALPSIVKGRNP